MPKTTQKNRDFLMKQSENFRNAINSDFGELKDESVRVGKAGMWIGSVLLGGYLIFQLLRKKESHVFSPDGEKGVVVVNPRKESMIVNSIKGAIASFLLAIAKQKLMEYLESKEILEQNK